MTGAVRCRMSSQCAMRKDYKALTWGVMDAFGWEIMGCFDRSLATSCQAFAPNSWIA